MCFYLRRRAARNQRPVGPGEWGVPPTTLSTSRSRWMPHPPRDRRGRRTRTPQRRRETRRVSGRTAFSWFAARSNESSLPHRYLQSSDSGGGSYARAFPSGDGSRTQDGGAIKKLGVRPESLGADKGYGSGEFLAWLLARGVQPHIPVIDRRHQTGGRFTREQFRNRKPRRAGRIGRAVDVQD